LSVRGLLFYFIIIIIFFGKVKEKFRPTPQLFFSFNKPKKAKKTKCNLGSMSFTIMERWVVDQPCKQILK
jgi:hypothetical protein